MWPDSMQQMRRLYVSLVIAILGLFVLLRCRRLTHYGLWFDETFSLYAARLGWRDLVGFVAKDVVHPPGFYLLLKVWVGLGGSALIWLKLLPLTAALLSIVFFVRLACELRLSKAEFGLAFFLISVNAYLIYYAQELRMYSALLCLTLWSLALFMRLTKDGAYRFPISLFLVNLLLIYTHYYGWLIVATQWCYLLLWRRNRLPQYSVGVFGLFVCYLPWVFLVTKTLIAKGGLAQNLQWLSRPQVSDVVWYYAMLNGTHRLAGTTAVGLIIFSFPVVVWLFNAARHPAESDLSLLKPLLFFSFIPVGFAFLGSYLLTQSIWGERYLIIASIPYLILISVAINRLPFATVRIVAALLSIAWATTATVAIMKRDDERLNWYSLTATLSKAESGQGKTKLYADSEFVASPIRFALETSGENRFEVIAANDMFGSPTLDIFQAAATENHFWMAFRAAPEETTSLEKKLYARGCHIDSRFFVSTANQRIVYFPVDCPWVTF